MRKNHYALVLTGTIHITGDVPFQYVVDSATRKKQYLDNLENLIAKRASDKIIFCDNSNTTCPNEIYLKAEKNNIKLEWLSFSGNTELVEKYGKGAGESEILDYVMDHSILLKDCSFFIKLTGRVQLRNIRSLTFSINEKANWFLTYGDGRLEMVDTRFFGMKVRDYRETLYHCFQCPEKLHTYTIERIYAQLFSEHKTNIRSLRIQPSFRGISGGYGTEYAMSINEEIRKTGVRFFKTINTPVLLEPLSLWQEDMIIPEEIWENTFGNLSGKRVFVCGANRLGCRFYKLARKKCKIVGWSDKKYINQRIYNIKITDIFSLSKVKCDYVAVTSKKESTFREFQQTLNGMGISNASIIPVDRFMHEKGYGRFTM